MSKDISMPRAGAAGRLFGEIGQEGVVAWAVDYTLQSALWICHGEYRRTTLLEWRRDIHPDDRADTITWAYERVAGSIHTFRVHAGGGRYVRIVSTLIEAAGRITRGRAVLAPANLRALPAGTVVAEREREREREVLARHSQKTSEKLA